MAFVCKGRHQNSLAAAPIFSRQLQPTRYRKNDTQLLNVAAFWLQPAVMNLMSPLNRQLFWWSASITLDNNNDVLKTFSRFSHFVLYHIPQLV